MGRPPTRDGWYAGGGNFGVTRGDGSKLTAGGTAPSGNPAQPPALGFGTGLGTYLDTNGNQKADYPGGLDTLGNTPVSVTQNGSNQLIYTVHDANGNPQTYTVNLVSVPFSTSFHAYGGYGLATEASGSFMGISSIILPNNQSYQFTYEQNGFGGISAVTLPSGATINYTWYGI